MLSKPSAHNYFERFGRWVLKTAHAAPAPTRWLPACLLLWLALTPRVAHAGLGPENVFLVVNRASWASLTVANYYIELRKIPAVNVLYLDWQGGTDTVDVDIFRKAILGPVLQQIDRRGLADQIDAIVYSSDFPYQINLAGDLKGQTSAPQLSPYASLTGATYLWQLVMMQSPVNVPGNNLYLRSVGQRVTDPPTQGFRSWYGWGPEGQVVEAGGVHYMLSTMLAVTSGRGNSVPEAVGYLRRSAQADGTRPKGTIFFCSTSDTARTGPRAPFFAGTVEELKALGVNAEIFKGTLPTGKRDVAGLLTGIANFDWPAAKSVILPGAICEHLTSFGGSMAENSSQTPLTEFLRYGAAGSSGTVVEPYGIQEKFPLAMMHVHYARGSSLAEAFYQSIFGPYQLLIVGDPLCQPWARIPKVSVEGVKPGETLSGKVSVKPTATVQGGVVDQFQMFLDGQRVVRRPAGSAMPLETTNFGDGYHELRVVGIDGSPIETQGRAILPIRIDNEQQTVELTVPKKEVQWGEKLNLSVKSSGATEGAVLANFRVVGMFKGQDGEVELDARDCGSGPVTLVAICQSKDEPPKALVSQPVRLEVKPGTPLPALAKPTPDQLGPGMQLKIADKPEKPIQATFASDWLHAAGVKSGDTYTLEGYFTVPPPAKNTVAISAADVAAQSVQQFQVRYAGDLKLVVDSTTLYDEQDGKGGADYVADRAAPGLHRLQITGVAGQVVRLEVRYGGEGTRSLDGTRFRQVIAK